MPPPDRRRLLQTRLFGWWYMTLALAFAALAWRSVEFGGPRLGVVLRAIIAAGFGVLGVITLRSAKARKPSDPRLR